MKTLALELSSGQGSIAFMHDGRECFAAEFANDRKHSGYFFENLQRCVEECGRAGRIVVGLGPGSYAGTRIAISAAIGLQAVQEAELRGAPSFCALPTDASEYIMIGDARRQSFWLAHVRARRALQGPMLCGADELSEQLSKISCPVFTAETMTAFPNVPRAYPSARLLAQLETTAGAPLEPIYLREPHITQPRKVGV